jgi:branched-chain amino acid transport system permease protein
VTGAFARTTTELGRAGGGIRAAWSPVATVSVVALVLVALVPLAPDGLDVHRLAGGFYLAVAATALGFVVGPAGLPSLGQAGFMGVGAFTAALLAGRGWPWVAACAAGLVTGAGAGVLTGIGAVRLKPVFVAVATWVATWLVALALIAFPSISGGAEGLVVPTGLTDPANYELGLVLLVAAVAVFATLARRVPGLGLEAARQRPAAAAALGVASTRLRLGAFVAAAAVAGLVGALVVQLEGIADPTAFGPLLSFQLLAAVVIGGARSALGPAVGVLVLAAARELGGAATGVVGLSSARFQTVVAAMLVLIVLSLDLPGLVPWLARRPGWERRTVEPTPVPPPAATPGTLTGQALTKRFGALVALAGLDIEVRPGSICALIGPNGSGKTTALRVLAGTLRPDSGRALLDGTPLPPGDTRGRATSGVVRTLQSTAVFPELTALENVLVGESLHRRHAGAVRTAAATPLARGEEALSRAHALALLDRVGLEHAADTPASELPGSAQRLVMIAAALAARPRVLLLDEPSAGASPSELERIAELLRSLRAQGLALLLVEHNLRLIGAVADDVVVLDAGEVIARGSYAEVARDEAVRDAYLGRRSADVRGSLS